MRVCGWWWWWEGGGRGVKEEELMLYQHHAYACAVEFQVQHPAEKTDETFACVPSACDDEVAG